MLRSLQASVRNKNWLAVVLCFLPVIIYILVFQSIALNVNYVAFDDILILGIIPGFEDASWHERWTRLTELFPEHRLVFSRSVILLIHRLAGRVDLVWLMSIANICWIGCIYIFYRAFKGLRLSVWYFLPVVWLWFSIQSYENMFWGVSSLCNFGVIMFVLGSIYVAIYLPEKQYIALLLAVLATFTYGNGLMVFPVIGLVQLLTGKKRAFVLNIIIAGVTAGIYFINFVPITQNLNFSNPVQVKEGFLGLFGFLGSIATIKAYGIPREILYFASGVGMLLVVIVAMLYWKEIARLWQALWGTPSYTNKPALFAFCIVLFVGITALALTYKRIPTDTYDGMFKGRYRMYSVLLCIAIYYAFLSLSKHQLRSTLAPLILAVTVVLNLLILHGNFGEAVNNRRAAVAQEFNARYNADWLGLKMFSMNQKHFEDIRSYYKSDDPLAEGWMPRSASLPSQITCNAPYTVEKPIMVGDHVTVNATIPGFKASKNFTDGVYIILKSPSHVYVSPPNQPSVPIKTTLRRGMYYSDHIFASFHKETVAPGVYQVLLLVRRDGRNELFCTGQIWTEN
ncbi:hypothetical protein DYBT9275_04667 [Dyadobacter sp. CECT 9275]|uniref:Uncharacterized protein n=1 Tax=Dyadobacter helix TaxID=2822344 RepID=A0A916JG68_9BACT|nr:hypothetical protein [Dyadobacter sp. CECT 9275]CAG5010219.1 hypothetical protein DYBT9275_04667 [Dyadobacter sp. CECT 9275]